MSDLKARQFATKLCPIFFLKVLQLAHVLSAKTLHSSALKQHINHGYVPSNITWLINLSSSDWCFFGLFIL